MNQAASPFERMRADHRRVIRTMAGLERAAIALDAQPAAARQQLERHVGTLERQFATHMAAEDEIVFPILMEALPSAAGSLTPMRAEHDDLRTMVSRLKATLGTRASRARNEQIRVQVRDLADLLRIHVRKEEAIAFRLAEQIIGPADGARLSARLAHYPTAGASRPRTKGRMS